MECYSNMEQLKTSSPERTDEKPYRNIFDSMRMLREKVWHAIAGERDVNLFPIKYFWKRFAEGATVSNSGGNSDGLYFGTRFYQYVMSDGSSLFQKGPEYWVDPEFDITDYRNGCFSDFLAEKRRRKGY